MRISTRILFIATCILIFISCTENLPRKYIISDFESDADMDRLIWKCHTLFSLSQGHATHGKSSLKMEFYPSPYPGLNPILAKKDWHHYKKLCFDIYNPEKHSIRINIRIDDSNNALRYEDRYNKSFILKPGMNRMLISLNTLLTSVTGKKINLKSICKLIIFMHKPELKAVLYIDYLRLEM